MGALVDLVTLALPLALAAFVFGLVLKVSDLVQEHGYRWFPGAAVVLGAAASALLLLVLWRSPPLHRAFWLAVLLHWILRGRIDGVNHGLFTTAAIVAMAFWDPRLVQRDFRAFLYFFVPLTVLGLVHDAYQYRELPGPEWLKAFFRNQHLYWYLILLGHPAVAPVDWALLFVGYAFVKGYGVFYSERACALLPRVGIAPPA